MNWPLREAALVTGLIGLLTFGLVYVFGAPEKPPEYVPPVNRPLDHTWVFQVMVGGPAVYYACVNGDRIYALQRQHSRGKDGLWPGASIAVVPGGCK